MYGQITKLMGSNMGFRQKDVASVIIARERRRKRRRSRYYVSRGFCVVSMNRRSRSREDSFDARTSAERNEEPMKTQTREMLDKTSRDMQREMMQRF